MSSPIDPQQYLTAMTDSGMLIIHSSPITLNWVPLDIVNDAYNVGGTVTVGTFDSLDEAKHAATVQYSITPERWQVSDRLAFDPGDHTHTEIHTPEIDGHNFVRHGIRWK